MHCAWVALMLAAGALPSRADPGAAEACDRHLESYLRSVLDGEMDAAARHWRLADVAASTRLDIRYAGPALKVDGDSPLWTHRDALRAGRIACRRGRPAPVESGALVGVMRQMVELASGSDTTRFAYYFAEQDGGWLLASPVALVAAGETGRSARYVSVYDGRAGAPRAATDISPASLDSCVGDMAARLRFTAADMARLERAKLGYLLADPADVERLAGAPTVGVANLQQDVVVTSHPCHAHELAHLVVNAWLKDLPPYMLPLLQEGAAVHLGGRWGRHSRILERLGRTTLADEMVTLDALLARDEFQRLPADLSYAPAGVFAGFLLEQFGPEGLRAACLSAGGDAAGLSDMSVEQIKAVLAAALGTSWDEIASAFARRVETPVGSGIVPGDEADDAPIAADLRREHVRVTVRGDPLAPRVGVTVTADSGTPVGAILFGGDDDAAPDNALFAGHFPGLRYRGQTHALIFTPDEAKLYDYRLQLLVALHAEGFWPSDSYRTGGGRILGFRVDRVLWPTGSMELVERQP